MRANAFRREPIPVDVHVRWLEAHLADVGSRIWVLERGSVPVGQVRYERLAGVAEVDISIAPEERGHGYGVELLLRTTPLACAELGVLRLVALVLPENAPSLRAFARAGYVVVGREERHGQTAERFERRCTGPRP